MELLEFVGLLGVAAAELELGNRQALEHAGQVVEDAAKEAMGTYKFGWPPLAPETVAGKATGDSPLLETGELRDSIGHTVVDAHTCDVGSNDPKAAYHELGTARIPPRSFLVAAAMDTEAEVVAVLGEGAVKALIAP